VISDERGAQNWAAIGDSFQISFGVEYNLDVAQERCHPCFSLTVLFTSIRTRN
jgi:hypothetical protein